MRTGSFENCSISPTYRKQVMVCRRFITILKMNCQYTLIIKRHIRCQISLFLLLYSIMVCKAAELPEIDSSIKNIQNRSEQSINILSDDKLLQKMSNFENTVQRNPFDPVIKEPEYGELTVNKTDKGKHITLNFKDIKLRAVLQLLAEFSHMNLVVSDSVVGNITLCLNDVTSDEALDVILTTQGLDKRQRGGVWLIDKASALVARENATLIEQEALQKLTPLHAELLQINYAKAADLGAMLKDKSNLLLSQRGGVSVDVRTNTLWLQETEEKIKEIRAFVHRLDVPIQQVIIEARIVDLVKTCEDDLGVRWGVSKPGLLSGTLVGANQLKQGILPVIAERLNQDFAALPLAGLGAPASIGLAIAKLGDGILLDLELSALESEGRAEIIARPRLMTTNQQSAMIHSGEDIPYQQSTSSGATAVAFKKAVLSLKVTPQITPDGQLLMELLITQDSNSLQRVNGVPIVTTKSIQTNVLVNNGQTIVLGGIYTRNKNDTMTRIPFLGGLPIVGRLFSRTQTTSNNEELLIFITPRIMPNNHSKKKKPLTSAFFQGAKALNRLNV